MSIDAAGVPIAGDVLTATDPTHAAWEPITGTMTNPMQAQDDLIVGGTVIAGTPPVATPTRLPVGPAGDVLTVDPLTGHVTWERGVANPMIAIGDLITASAVIAGTPPVGVPDRIGAGAAGTVLTSNGAGTEPSWQSSTPMTQGGDLIVGLIPALGADKALQSAGATATVSNGSNPENVNDGNDTTACDISSTGTGCYIFIDLGVSRAIVGARIKDNHSSHHASSVQVSYWAGGAWVLLDTHTMASTDDTWDIPSQAAQSWKFYDADYLASNWGVYTASLFIASASPAGTPERLAVGSDGTVLTARSSATNGVDWETPAAGVNIIRIFALGG